MSRERPRLLCRLGKALVLLGLLCGAVGIFTPLSAWIAALTLLAAILALAGAGALLIDLYQRA